MNRRILSAIAVTGIAALAAAGCGSSDDNDTTSAAETTPATTTQATTTSAGKVAMLMSEFKFAPDDVTVPAGKVKITQKNVGQVVHEFVLIRTDKAADSFPVKNGVMDEEAAGEVVGEIADVKAGATASKTFDLKAGKYVFVCNITGHYPGGMYGSMTVQ